MLPRCSGIGVQVQVRFVFCEFSRPRAHAGTIKEITLHMLMLWACSVKEVYSIMCSIIASRCIFQVQAINSSRVSVTLIIVGVSGRVLQSSLVCLILKIHKLETSLSRWMGEFDWSTLWTSYWTLQWTAYWLVQSKASAFSICTSTKLL